MYVPCINRMPGGVIVSDSSLCCCVPVPCVTSIVRAQLIPFVCCFKVISVYFPSLGSFIPCPEYELFTRINKQREVIALEQLTSHVKQAHNNRDPSRLL